MNDRQRGQKGARGRKTQAHEDYQRFLQILKGVSEPICLINADFEVQWANQAHQQLFGATFPVVKNCCFSGDGTAHCEDCLLRLCLDSGRAQEALKSVGGRTLGIKMFPLGKLVGSVESVIAFSSDITEKLRQRKEAERQGRLMALGELAAGVAHEINNPNALVLLNAPLLREIWQALTPLLDQQATGGDFQLGKLPYSRLREEVPKLFLQMEHAAERIRSIVEELKDFVSPGERVLATIDLGTVVRLAVEQVQSMRSEPAILLQAETTPPVRGSAPRLEQVFVNLLTNAQQALDHSGPPIRVHMRHLPEEGVNLVEVVDEGAGMEPELLQRITDPFFTTRRNAGGLGLGLSVSARIVRDHGGRLHFTSALGRGTTVQVVLPACPGE